MRWALALGLGLIAPSSAGAYELYQTPGGVNLFWLTASLPYAVCFDPGLAEGQALASASRRAFDTWAFGSEGGLWPQYLGPCSTPDPGDGLITVSEDQSWDPAFGEPDRAVAYAWVHYDANTGQMRDADVHLNAENFQFGDLDPGAFDRESVVLHELGHVLGLAHSCGLPGGQYPSCFSVPDDPPGRRLEILEAVMAPTLSPGTARRDLGADDLQGLVQAFHGGMGPRPIIQGLSRACPDADWRLQLSTRSPDALEVFVRQANGVVGRRTVERVPGAWRIRGPEPAPGVWDLVVFDPATRTYDAWVDLEAPAPCPGPVDAGATNPNPKPNPTHSDSGGCNCISDPPTLSGRSMAGLVMLVGLMLRRRTRRKSRPRRGSGPVLVAALLSVLCLPQSAAAFECSRTGGTTGPSLVWAVREVPWYAGPKLFAITGDEVVGEAEVRGSFAAWEDEDSACSDLMFPFKGVAQVQAGFDEEGNNENAVVVVEQLWPYQSGAIAVTTTAYDPRTGVVVDADIEFNRVNFRFVAVDADTMCGEATNLMDLRNTLTHEIGHVLGLEHPPNLARYAESTMYASAPACETKKRTLDADDIEGLCFIYPAGAATQPCYPADGPSFIVVAKDDGFGGCQSVPGEALPLWGLLLGGLLRRRRRG